MLKAGNGQSIRGAFSPDGKHLATACHFENMTYIWTLPQAPSAKHD